MKRQLTFLFLAFIMLGTVLFFYVHNILLPVKIKNFFEEQAQQQLQRRIAIDDFHFTPFKGFRIVNLKIYDGPQSQELLFYADEVRFNVLFAALFQHRALIIPSLHLTNPSLHLIRESDGRWNISDLIGPSSGSKYKLLVRKIVIEHGALDLTDRTGGTEFFESFHEFDLEAQITLNQTVQYAVDGRLPLREASLESKGQFSLSAPKLAAWFRLNNVPLALYLPRFGGIPGMDARALTLSSDGVKVSYTEKDLVLEGDLAAPSIDATVNDTVILGSLETKRLSVNFKEGRLTARAYVAPRLKISTNSGIELELASRMHVQDLRWRSGSLEGLADIILDESRLRWNDRQLALDSLSVTGLKIHQAGSLSLTMNDVRFKKLSLTSADRVDAIGEAALVKTNIFYKPSDLSLDTQGLLHDVQVTLDGKKHLLAGAHLSRLHGRLEDERLSLEGDLALSQAEIDLGRQRTFYGDPMVHLRMSADLSGATPPAYKGRVVLDNALIANLPHIESVKNIQGTLSIDNDRLSSERLGFNTLNTNFTAQGGFSVRHPYLADAVIKTAAFDLAMASPILERHAPARIQGEAAVAARYQGPLSPLSLRHVALGALLNNASITFTAFGQELSGINGSINYVDNALHWEEIGAVLNNMPLKSTGRMTAEEQPVIDGSIKIDQLDAQARLTCMGDYFLVDRFTGRYAHSSFDTQGTIDRQQFVRLTGQGRFDLRDLDKLPQQVYDVVKKATPAGAIDWQGSFKGRLDDWRGAAVHLEGRTDAARLIHYPLENVHILYDQRNRSVENLAFAASVYGGDLKLAATGDLSQEAIPFQSFTTLQGLDLARYRQDKKPQNDMLSGNLQCAFDMEGELLKLDSYTGAGKLDISDAFLGQLIPHNDAPYTQAHADFVIKQQKVETHEARIISHPIDLVAQGWVDFDQNMNFNIVPVVKKLEYIEGNNGLTPRLTETVNVTITGKLGHPVKQVAASPAKVIKTTAGAIKDGIGAIVGEFF